MLLAQTSGFGVYLLASSAPGVLTASLGVTLPFAAYTMMASVIHIFIGPAGWLGMGLLAVHHLTGPNFNRLTAAVAMVHCIRARLLWEEEDRLRRFHEEERLKAERARRSKTYNQQGGIRAWHIFAVLFVVGVLWYVALRPTLM
jgi:hypothetical protein